jgi:hypothetical protein
MECTIRKCGEIINNYRLTKKMSMADINFLLETAKSYLQELLEIQRNDYKYLSASDNSEELIAA